MTNTISGWNLKRIKVDPSGKKRKKKFFEEEESRTRKVGWAVSETDVFEVV